MQKYFLIIFSLFCLTLKIFGQSKPYKIITADVDNFWVAYDSLSFANSTQDSVRIIQNNYINKGTEGLKEFFKARPYTSKDYVNSISKYPKFWRSLEHKTQIAKNQKPAIEQIYAVYQKHLPNFRPPNICFAIGILNSGGTTTKDWILIGTEMVTVDSTVDKSELSPSFSKILDRKDVKAHIVSIIAHEAVHTQQATPSEPTFYGMIISEGAADFIPELLLKLITNPLARDYGKLHECELWNEFEKDVENNTTANNWLYNGYTVKGKPADLGYFIGAQICRAYYEKAKDKKQALKDILQDTDYFKLVKNSGYNGTCSHLSLNKF